MQSHFQVGHFFLDLAELCLILAARQMIRAKLRGNVRLKLAPQDSEIWISPYRPFSVFKFAGLNALHNEVPADSIFLLGRNVAEGCPFAIPNNFGLKTFDVEVTNTSHVATLNISPTISSLLIGPSASVEVNDASGASVRTLAVDGTISNDGVLRAAAGRRMVIDAPFITAMGTCTDCATCTGIGTIEATNMDVPAGQKSVVEINGAVIDGGILRTIEPNPMEDPDLTSNAEIHLIGGATMVNTCVQGVVVPNGQAGAFSSVVTNRGLLEVSPVGTGSLITLLSVGPLGGTLQGEDDGAGNEECVRLGGRTKARLGEFKSSFINAGNHVIDGAGVIFGGFENRGCIRANDPGATEQLIVFPPGVQSNVRDVPNGYIGEMMATQGGTLRIASNMINDGRIIATAGGTVEIEGELTGGGGLIAAGGTILIRGVRVASGECHEIPPPSAVVSVCDSSVVVPGQFSVSSRGIIESRIEIQHDSMGNPGELIATTPGNGNDLNVRGGTFRVQDVGSKALFAGPVSICPTPGEIARLELVDAQFAAGNFSVCAGGVVSTAGNSMITVGGAMTFGNTIENDWTLVSSSTVQLNGGVGLAENDHLNYAKFEIGGTDHGDIPVGYTNNFAIPKLVIGPDAHIVLVDLIENGNHGGPVGFNEALYVDTLEFVDPNGRLNVNGLHLYFGQLNGNANQIIDVSLPGAPTVSGWGTLVLMLLIATAGTLIQRKKPEVGVFPSA